LRLGGYLCLMLPARCAPTRGEGFCAMILIHPPVSKPCEPPAGIARLCGSLKRHGIPCEAMDASLQGILSLLEKPPRSSDTWTSRAFRHLPAHLHLLTRREGYENADRYRRAVLDVNRVMEKSVAPGHVRVSLANYSDSALSPVRSRDLIAAAERPDKNPFYEYFVERIHGFMEEKEHGAVGFSLNYLNQALCTFSMMGILRHEFPRVKIIVGGGLVTSWMRRPGWKNPFAGLVDDMVPGPGEEALISILGKEYVKGADSPDYDSFLRNKYFAPGFILPYSASSGCYWHRCSFCPEKAEANPYRPIAPGQAVEEVKGIANRSNPVLLHFLDNAMSPALLEEIACHGLDSPWYGFARITKHLAEPDFCFALKRSGCAMLKLGLESGDQDVLDDLEKGIDLDEASRVLRSLKRAGIGTYVYLLFGTPAETIEGARRTLDFTVAHRECIDFLNLAVFNMPVCGPDSEKLETSPFYEGDLSLYTSFVHPSGWDRASVRTFLDREFKRHPAIASILKRDPPFFTSNHAAFFVSS
jgi:radical SAM superfamily enzyme YgiQ (UPF0313 family)